jgi:hypothetical protein
MANRPPPGQCVHCLRYRDQLTWDHVFPRAWYPDSTPANLAKWKFPSCFDCNQAFGRLEENLLWIFGMCIDPADAKSAGISEKVIRSMDPRRAPNKREANARIARHRALRTRMKRLDPNSAKSTLPGFGPRSELPDQLGFEINADDLARLGTKIIRGLTYVRLKLFIGPQYEFTVYPVEEQAARPVMEFLDRLGILLDQGPGLSVYWASASDDPISGVFKIEIWGRLRLYATVDKRDGDSS